MRHEHYKLNSVVPLAIPFIHCHACPTHACYLARLRPHLYTVTCIQGAPIDKAIQSTLQTATGETLQHRVRLWGRDTARGKLTFLYHSDLPLSAHILAVACGCSYPSGIPSSALIHSGGVPDVVVVVVEYG